MSTHTDEDSSFSRNVSFFKRIKSIFTKNLDHDLQDIIEGRDDTEQPLSKDEKELLSSALRFGAINVDEACVPRSDIVYLSKNDGFNKVVKAFKDSGYSRLPVCGKDLDEVVGFVTLKDIFQYMGDEHAFDLKKGMRACTFVPESFAISAVLDEMRNSAVQMAIVVDEYGGTSGLITVKDIMEELVGDLDDENEQEDNEEIIELVEGRYLLDARLEIEDLEDDMAEKIGANEDGEYETVGGFVLELAGKVPDEGEYVALPTGGNLIVTKADGRRIHKVTYIPPQA